MASDPPALVQARSLFQAGRLDEARDLVQRFLKRDPAHAEANHSMAVLLIRQRQHERALYFAQRAAAAPVADYFITLASVLDALGQREPALAAAARAAELNPRDAANLLAVVPLYWGMGELGLALSTAEAAMAADRTLARGPYANVLCWVGEVERAIDHLRAELARDPNARDVLIPLVQSLNYSASADPIEVFELHRRLGQTYAAVPRTVNPAVVRDPDRRLRIGLISPDLYSQSVAFFAEPLIEHLDRASFEVVCYSSHPDPDATTRRLKGLADHWRDITGADDAAVLRVLSEDRPDILIELAGITMGSVLSIMAARPAPVQVTAIGYPNTTGLPAIDYRLVDAITDPPGAEALAVEGLARIPGCFLCYRPLTDAPPPNPRPGRPEGITFGSFNVTHKISAPALESWVRIVNAVPGSKLLLKSSQLASANVRERYAERFRAAGLDPSRLELLGPVKDKAQHLAVYDRIDIALDPFPYNGTTTTCEALDMGVPVITLEGRVHAARVGMSLLTAAGLPELIAPTPDDYVRLATGLAADRARLSALKHGLRARHRASTLCDAAGYSAKVGVLLRDMWRDYCRAP